MIYFFKTINFLKTYFLSMTDDDWSDKTKEINVRK